MVNPILIIAITLMAAFSIGIFQFLGKKFVKSVFWLTILFDLYAIYSIAYSFITEKIVEPIVVKIGGFAPPIGINLSVDAISSYLGFVIFFIGAGAAYHWMKKGIEEPQPKAYILFLLILLGSIGIIFTQDFFNLFVFIEITSIASYGLVASKLDGKALEASFKYLIVGSISSMLVLLGAVLLYKFYGSLNMADISSKIAVSHYSGAILIMVTMFLFGLLIELEMFPMNGWALDVYEGANPAIIAILAGGIVKAFLLVFVKSAIYLKYPYLLKFGLIFGLTTYLVSQFFAWKQNNIRRLFGYSSVGQLGLLVLAGGFYTSGILNSTSKTYMLLAIVFFVLNHSFSKSTLFFLSDLIDESEISGWKGVLRKNKFFKFMFSTSVFSIAGAPPFLGFWAKLFFILAIPQKYFFVVVLVLIGAIAEIVYYFRLYRIADEESEKEFEIKGSTLPSLVNTIVIFFISTIGGFFFFTKTGIYIPETMLLLFAGSILVFVFGFSRILQWLISLGLTGYAFYMFMGNSMSLSQFFLMMILIGSFLFLFASYPVSKKYSSMFYPLFLLTIFSMVGISLSKDWIMLFIFWELMSWFSYMIINSSNTAKKASWIYLILSAIGGYAMLSGIKLLSSSPNLIPQFSAKAFSLPILSSILIFTAFLVKMATSPLHIWARDAYAESPDAFTPALSGILSKMGVFGGILTVLYLIPHIKSSSVILYGLGWLGALTALFMTLFAVFQEDAKRVLAYSSVGQVGYILIGLALSTSLGYSAALYHTVNHLIFKGLLFVAIAGVIYRAGTSYLPELGGLIRKMPFTFFAFLLGIITLAGIPPLSGFAGKWLLYTALIEKGWIFILIVAMMASTIAFLYCFKLLHSIFLGQPKDKFKDVKKAPITINIVQILLALLTMAIGAKPELLLNFTEKVIKTTLGFATPGYTYASTFKIVSSVGYWNAWFMMVFTAGTFITVLVLFAINNPKIRKVGQLDIGYSGEVPDSPESVHYGYNIYAHFKRVVWFVLKPVIENIYKGIYKTINAVVDFTRRFYTGDVNTYAIWVVISLITILYLLNKGVF